MDDGAWFGGGCEVGDCGLGRVDWVDEVDVDAGVAALAVVVFGEG